MDPDVVEIPPPPISRPPRMLKHKEVMRHDVIEIDQEEDNVDLMLFGEIDDKNVKGKAIKFVADGYNDHSAEEAMANTFGLTGVEALGSLNVAEASKPLAPPAHHVINLEGQSSDASCDDDNDDIDLFSEDFMDIDEYAMLQAHFDNVDIPPGIEAPIPFMLDPPKRKKKPITGSSSVQMPFPIQSGTVGLHGINSSSSSSSSPSLSLEPSHFTMNQTSGSGTNLPIHMDFTSHPGEVELLPPWHIQSSQSKKKVTTLQHRGAAPNIPLGVTSKSRWRRTFHCRKKQLNLSSSTNYDPVNKLEAMKLPLGVEPSSWNPHIPDNIRKPAGTNIMQSPSFPMYIDMPKLPNGVEPSLPWSHAPFNANFKSSFFNNTAHLGFYHPLGPTYHPQETADIHPWLGHFDPSPKNDAAVGSSTNGVGETPKMDRDEVLRKFGLFKQFDTVDDHSDHHYTRNGFSLKQSSKTWTKRIQEEWKILEKDLPDTIFVRVYEARMDLLRAVIVGAEGTPYHDGLFFFDVYFPGSYPNVPPHVYYHSGGLRLNPNLYNTGKVCLSLLNTWSGDKNEKWIPGTSTMLQVLVSIQGLILNTKPYFNEPGYAPMSGSVDGEKRSLQYNENTFILSLRTMMYLIKRPPKHFEDLVMGHFFNRAQDILVACKAYMDGAQVGCLVKGGVQDVDEGDKSCSKQFKDSLAGVVNMLVKELSQIGVEDCEKFLSPTVNVNTKSGRMSQVAS